ncbi:MAG: hypothetical protein OEV64_11935 [Desulfobulbaceae bacterium]|nr:hypothetical protein [Desulfobulbaceae bacterium]
MKIVLISIGVILCAVGAVDFIGSFVGFDLWGEKIGITLPEILWKYSAYLEFIAGYFAFKVGMAMNDSDEISAESV